MIDSSPLQDAIDRMHAKTPVARALSSAEWADVPQEIRDRSFWTARFAEADLLQLMHDKISTALEMGREEVKNGTRLVNRSTFIGDMKVALSAAGYMPEPGDEGTIKDHSSRGRLGMIYDINTRLAAGYGGWVAGQSQGALDAFPAQELYRESSRKVPRNWRSRWAAHGGQSFAGGRMIALKNDPIWSTISTFGSPYPPFDYNSGMGIRNISRSEAIALGVMSDKDRVRPMRAGLNDGLEASAQQFSPDILKSLAKTLGDRAVLEDGKLRYVGGPQS